MILFFYITPYIRPVYSTMDFTDLQHKLSKTICTIREDQTEEIDSWLQKFHKANPKLDLPTDEKEINDPLCLLINCIERVYKNISSTDECNTAVQYFMSRHYEYVIRRSIEPEEAATLLEPTYVMIRYIVDQKTEIEKLKKANQQLIDENTELLLRPSGPVAIELGKRFVQNANIEEYKL